MIEQKPTSLAANLLLDSVFVYVRRGKIVFGLFSKRGILLD